MTSQPTPIVLHVEGFLDDKELMQIVNRPIEPGTTLRLSGPIDSHIARELRRAFSYRTIPDEAYSDGGQMVSLTTGDNQEVGRLYIGPRPRYQLSGIFSTIQSEICHTSSLRGSQFCSREITEYMCRLFALPERHQQLTRTLSGGESERLMLALCALAGAPVFLFNMSFAAQDRRYGPLCRLFIDRFVQGTKRVCFLVDRCQSRQIESAAPVVPSFTDREVLCEITAGKFFSSFSTEPIVAFPALTIASEDIWLVQGPNGSGKTLLGRYIIGALPNGIKVKAETHAKLPSIRAAYLPQDPAAIFWHATVKEEIGDECHSPRGIWGDPATRDAATSHLDLRMSPFELSVSAQKWLGVVKAMSIDATLYFFDEPTEYWTGSDVELFVSVLAKSALKGRAVIIATHDDRLVNALRASVAAAAVRELRLETSQPHPVWPSDRPKIAAGKSIVLPNDLTATWESIHRRWPKYQLAIFESWSRRLDPCLHKLSRSLLPVRTYLDLGCGNGLQTLFVASLLQSSEENSTLMIRGLDWSSLPIAVARLFAPAWVESHFDVCDICHLDQVNSCDSGAQYDLVSSFFALHDVASAEDLTAVISAKLSINGRALIAMINPAWVEERADGAGPPAGNIPTDAEWCGLYRLGDDGEGIQIPYFHRSLRAYRRLFSRVSLHISSVMAVSDSAGEVCEFDDLDSIGHDFMVITLVLTRSEQGTTTTGP